MGEQVYLGFDDGGAWPYPAGWHPDELPGDVAEIVRAEPVLAQIGAMLEQHREGWVDLSQAAKYLRTYWAPRLLQGRPGAERGRVPEQQAPRPPKREPPKAAAWEWVETTNPYGEGSYGRLQPAQEPAQASEERDDETKLEMAKATRAGRMEAKGRAALHGGAGGRAGAGLHGHVDG
jgi:hypothetical protein